MVELTALPLPQLVRLRWGKKGGGEGKEEELERSSFALGSLDMKL